MDIRTGQTYETLESARRSGVPEADIAHVTRGGDGEPRPSFAKPPALKFTKGSFKPVEQVPVVR